MTAALVQLAPVLAIPLAAALLWLLWRRVAKGLAKPGLTICLSVGLIAIVAATIVVPFVITQSGASLDRYRIWAAAALGVGSITTLGLLTRALIGDRSRGRRRCPRCWYDMGGVGRSLLCPECAHNARHERRLFLPRRRWSVVALSVLPFVTGAALFGTWFFRQTGWVQSMPTLGLTAASPWLVDHHHMAWELRTRMQASVPPELSWDARLQAFVSHRVVRHSPNERTAVYHASLLGRLERHDSGTIEALIALTKSNNAGVVEHAAEQLGIVREDPDLVEPALAALLFHPDQGVHYTAVTSLLAVKPLRPGDPPPAPLIADCRNRSNKDLACKAMIALRLYDPSDEVKAALIAAMRGDIWMWEIAVGSLTVLFPDDPRTQGAIVVAMEHARFADDEFSVLGALADGDGRSAAAGGTLPPRRLALYTPEVRAALIRAAAMGGYSSRIDAWLRSHPTFTDEELAAVNDALDHPSPPPPARRRGRY